MDEKIGVTEAEKGTEFMPLSEAAKLTGYTPEYLNLLSRQKKLKAEKIGRNWHTKKVWVNEFLASNPEMMKRKAISSGETNEEKIEIEAISENPSDKFSIEKIEKIYAEARENEKTYKEFLASEIKKDEKVDTILRADSLEGKWRMQNKKEFLSDAREEKSGNWLKFFAIMSTAIIIPIVLVAGRMMKLSIQENQKNDVLAEIYSGNQDAQTKISNENSENGKVAGIQETNTGEGVMLASANYKISGINVGGNVTVLSGENNKSLQIENIKSDSFADSKKNETSLVVAWQTNKMALSELDYSKSGGQNPESLQEDSYGFSHSAVVSGLEPGTPYVFQVKSKDRWANEVSSDFFGVYTASKPVSVFDLISNAVGDVFGWAIKK